MAAAIGWANAQFHVASGGPILNVNEEQSRTMDTRWQHFFSGYVLRVRPTARRFFDQNRIARAVHFGTKQNRRSPANRTQLFFDLL